MIQIKLKIDDPKKVQEGRDLKINGLHKNDKKKIKKLKSTLVLVKLVKGKIEVGTKRIKKL